MVLPALTLDLAMQEVAATRPPVDLRKMAEPLALVHPALPILPVWMEVALVAVAAAVLPREVQV